MLEVKTGQLEEDGRQYDAFWVEKDGEPVAKLFFTAVDRKTILTNRSTNELFRRQGLQKALTEAFVQYMRQHNYRYIKSSISLNNIPSLTNRLNMKTTGMSGVFLTTIRETARERLQHIAASTKKKYPESFDFITDINTIVEDNDELLNAILDIQEKLL